MASRKQTIKRWILIASSTLLALIVAIAAMLWSESQRRDVIRNTQSDLQDSLRNLDIRRSGKTDIRMRLTDDHWLIHEPCTVVANEQRLQPLLSIMSPAVFSYNANDVDLDAAGLVDPLATLIADNTRIDIGNTDLSGERRYAKRSDRVGFIPEWILPLLDGGLSALSVLDVFSENITSVSVEKLDAKQNWLSDDPADWQQLTAQQIVSWPSTDNSPLEHPYSVTIRTGTVEQQLQVFTTAAYAALVFDNGRCAYLLPNDALRVSDQQP